MEPTLGNDSKFPGQEPLPLDPPETLYSPQEAVEQCRHWAASLGCRSDLGEGSLFLSMAQHPS